MGKRLPMIQWECQKTGDCCRSSVIMTTQERLVLEGETRVRSLRGESVPELTWQTKDGFELLNGPCPFLGEDNLCTVYEIRPYNCRRFACFREPGEEFSVAASVAKAERDRSIRRQWMLIQRRAQKWALKHGWGDAPSNITQ